jgi:hypothetical protein
VADESVVVSKVRPVKPSNGVEGKTGLTISNASDGVLIGQKRSALRREEVHFKSVLSRCFFFRGAQTDSRSGYSVSVRCGNRGLERETVQGSSSVSVQ